MQVITYLYPPNFRELGDNVSSSIVLIYYIDLVLIKYEAVFFVVHIVLIIIITILM